ncbi:low-specificity L-threonine aldolase [bacterium]|nr:low-specificity L-threonine aldolase [bacterium]
MIDLRSDTVTRPTPMMLEAMMSTRVGDDVFGDDPAVNALQEKAAALFGMEAALFCPSGTMTNQIAINVHTKPGGEVICEENSHIYAYEGGGIAKNSGCSVKLIKGNKGRINAQQVEAAIRADDVHFPNTQLVSLENTSNKGGGTCYDFDDILAIKKVCDKHELALHLDGARLFNALVAKNQKPEDYGKVFHSISICLSKGLGCPVGSLLLGSHDFIYHARRVRKVMGGGMRQAGYLAAAGIYALEHHIVRLQDDHELAQKLARKLENADEITTVWSPETNIVVGELESSAAVDAYLEKLMQKGILAVRFGENTIRMVAHLGVDREAVERVGF